MTKQIKSNFTETLRMTAAVFLTLFLGVTCPGTNSILKAQTPAQTTASSRGDGQKEGIAVHGHWVIEVRNPDGTLATRREFDNGFFGHLLLARILGRDATPGYWQITLSGSAFANNFIAIPEPGAAPGPTIFPNLTVSFPTTGVNANALVLKGNGTALSDGDITKVDTQNFFCVAAIAPASCGFANVSDKSGVTGTTLSPAITNIVTGQIIQVTVVISFS